jgi:WxL domain surface cell wall-binding
MGRPRRIISSRLTLLLAGGVLLTGGSGASALLAAPAQASTCVTPAACSLTGTLTLSAGTLNLTTDSTLGWSAAVTGSDLNLVDATSPDETYTVVDASGAAAGWHITVAATTFTTGTVTLAAAGTFSTNGSITSKATAGYPTAACTTGSTCTVPTHTTAPTVFPVAITTAASAPTPYVIYDADAGTGVGSIAIGGSGNPAPVGWWLNVPGNTKPGTYTSNISIAVISAP